MREIDVKEIAAFLEEAAGRIAHVYSLDILASLEKAKESETKELSVRALEMLVENARIAQEKTIPICQDTGMAIVFLTIGQDVHFTGGNLYDAVNEGIARGYMNSFLRASIVDDPLFERKNTGNNTPAVIYSTIVPGDKVEVELMAKGFGSENKSRIAMLTVADGIEGVERFVLETIAQAGPNACPPFIVGVGIGGSFDSCALLAKKALLRPLDTPNPNESYRLLEERLLAKANQLKVGPLGFGGVNTALKVQVEYAPTHIAGLPIAVNMCCHACRHAKVVI